MIGQAQGFVHKDFSPSGFGDHPRSRSAHAVRVFDHVREGSVCITHMHCLRDLAGKIDTPERAAQARRLLDLARSISKPEDLSIICGDFNVEPGSETIGILTDSGMSELVTSRGFTGTRSSYYQRPGRFADYMFINRRDAVQSFDVIADPEMSDHCPLVLRI